jgi:hypothetical protein
MSLKAMSKFTKAERSEFLKHFHDTYNIPMDQLKKDIALCLITGVSTKSKPVKKEKKSPKSRLPASPDTIDDTKCMCRVWRSGNGGQCSRDKIPDTLFCKQHSDREKYDWTGLMGKPRPTHREGEKEPLKWKDLSPVSVSDTKKAKKPKADKPEKPKVDEPKVESVDEPKKPEVEKPKVDEPKKPEVEKPKVDEPKKPKKPKAKKPKKPKVEKPKAESDDEIDAVTDGYESDTTQAFKGSPRDDADFVDPPKDESEEEADVETPPPESEEEADVETPPPESEEEESSGETSDEDEPVPEEKHDFTDFNLNSDSDSESDEE